ncbi:unnamed protein product [Acanthosepion pharaonis]|uniref:Uncharacterized protein n=1 Tax=Acanthosepion pharaonis TaxID=158019 RepID=A0A812EL57_ACAPH|nr:unnamed protein product [Sepia pharaonis]
MIFVGKFVTTFSTCLSFTAPLTSVFILVPVWLKSTFSFYFLFPHCFSFILPFKVNGSLFLLHSHVSFFHFDSVYILVTATNCDDICDKIFDDVLCSFIVHCTQLNLSMLADIYLPLCPYFIWFLSFVVWKKKAGETLSLSLSLPLSLFLSLSLSSLFLSLSG